MSSGNDEKELMARQRQRLLAIADKLVAGDVLDSQERTRAAVVIRAWADQCMTWQPPRKGPGRKAMVDHEEVALYFASLINDQDLTKTAAYEKVEEEYGIGKTMMGKIWTKHGDWVEQWRKYCAELDNDERQDTKPE